MIVVHVMRMGSALCRFTLNVPREWPDGHQWTMIDDIEHVTCDECRARATSILAAAAAQKL